MGQSSRPGTYSDTRVFLLCMGETPSNILKVIETNKELGFPIQSQHTKIGFSHLSIISPKFDEVSNVKTEKPLITQWLPSIYITWVLRESIHVWNHWVLTSPCSSKASEFIRQVVHLMPRTWTLAERWGWTMDPWCHFSPVLSAWNLNNLIFKTSETSWPHPSFQILLWFTATEGHQASHLSLSFV